MLTKNDFIKDEMDYLSSVIDKYFIENLNALNDILGYEIADMLIDNEIPIYEWTPDSWEMEFDDSGDIVKTGVYLTENSKEPVSVLLNNYTGNWEPTFQSHHGKSWRTYDETLGEFLQEHIRNAYYSIINREIEGGKIPNYYRYICEEYVAGSWEDNKEEVIAEMQCDIDTSCEYNEYTIWDKLDIIQKDMKIDEICKKYRKEILRKKEMLATAQKEEERKKKIWDNYIRSLPINPPYNAYKKYSYENKNEIIELETNYSSFEIIVMYITKKIDLSNKLYMKHYPAFCDEKEKFLCSSRRMEE